MSDDLGPCLPDKTHRKRLRTGGTPPEQRTDVCIWCKKSMWSPQAGELVLAPRIGVDEWAPFIVGTHPARLLHRMLRPDYNGLRGWMVQFSDGQRGIARHAELRPWPRSSDDSF